MRLGVTRQGTVIEYNANQEVEEFVAEFSELSDEDKFDVYCMYQWLTVRAKRKFKTKYLEYGWFSQRLDRIRELLHDDIIEKEKLKANAITSYKMVKLGIQMVDHLLREF